MKRAMTLAAGLPLLVALVALSRAEAPGAVELFADTGEIDRQQAAGLTEKLQQAIRPAREPNGRVRLELDHTPPPEPETEPPIEPSAAAGAPPTDPEQPEPGLTQTTRQVKKQRRAPVRRARAKRSHKPSAPTPRPGVDLSRRLLDDASRLGSAPGVPARRVRARHQKGPRGSGSGGRLHALPGKGKRLGKKGKHGGAGGRNIGGRGIGGSGSGSGKAGGKGPGGGGVGGGGVGGSGSGSGGAKGLGGGAGKLGGGGAGKMGGGSAGKMGGAGRGGGKR